MSPEARVSGPEVPNVSITAVPLGASGMIEPRVAMWLVEAGEKGIRPRVAE